MQDRVEAVIVLQHEDTRFCKIIQRVIHVATPMAESSGRQSPMQAHKSREVEMVFHHQPAVAWRCRQPPRESTAPSSARESADANRAGASECNFRLLAGAHNAFNNSPKLAAAYPSICIDCFFKRKCRLSSKHACKQPSALYSKFRFP